MVIHELSQGREILHRAQYCLPIQLDADEFMRAIAMRRAWSGFMHGMGGFLELCKVVCQWTMDQALTAYGPMAILQYCMLTASG